MQEAYLHMKNIHKSFSGNSVLEGIDFSAFRGKAVALLGENGAGKSVLMKILCGVHQADSGTILMGGKELHMSSPRDAYTKGIGMIFQELNLIPELTVYENIFLGAEPRTTWGLDKARMKKEALALLKRLRVSFSVEQKAKRLSVGKQQMVEIAKVLSQNAELIIMDEPTATLSDQETQILFSVMRTLKEEGKAIIYISHRLQEIFEICDDRAILRNGKLITQQSLKELHKQQIVEMMVGKEITDLFPHVSVKRGSEYFVVSDLCNEKIKNVSFSLHEGEILGIAGLAGSGRTEIALSMYGADAGHTQGNMQLNGTTLRIRSPYDALKAGIVYVSEDRKDLGLLLDFKIYENIVLPVLQRYEDFFFHLSSRAQQSIAQEYTEELKVRSRDVFQKVKELSGGNQQKVYMAKALLCKPKVLILDEPSRGVDPGARREIYRIINNLKKSGLGIILISSDFPELLGLSDRIAVLYNGTLSTVLERDSADQHTVMRYAMGDSI